MPGIDLAMDTSSRVTHCEGGLRIATIEMPWMHSACCGIWCGAGSRHEPRYLQGISHFLEHMLFKGTRKRSARRLVADIERHGGQINAFTAEDHTCYYAKAPAEHLVGVVDVLCDLYRFPSLRERDCERERDVISEEIRGYQDNATTRVEELLDSALWPAHPLGHPVTGTVSSLQRISREDLVARHSRSYVAANTVFVAAGRVRHEKVVEAVSSRLRGLPAGRRQRDGNPPSKPPVPALVESMDVEQCHIELGFRAFGRRHIDRFALRLLSVLLAETMGSRLFQLLREKLAVCYHVHSDLSLLGDTGALVLSLSLDAGALPQALDIIFEECRSLAHCGCSRSELSTAQGYAVGQLLMATEKVDSRMFQAGESLLGFDRLVDPSETIALLKKVTRDDIARVAAYVLNAGQRASAAVCNPQEAPQVEKLLREAASKLH